MKIEKLPSGSYRVRITEKGKTYSVVTPHKPTDREAWKLLQDKINNKITQNLSFKDAAEQYNSAKKNVLSPRTIREYSLYIERLPGHFTALNLYDMNQLDIQQCINEISQTRSAKTVRCLHGYISAVLGMFRPDFILHTSLPQKIEKEIYIPTTDDIKKILDYAKDHETVYLVPIWLGCLSLRRSEICALTIDDLDGTTLTINKALVQDSNKNWIVKTTKTTKSSRIITLPQELADLIRAQGYVFNGCPGQISKCLKRIQKKLNMPEFSLHKTRHYFASRMIDAGYDMKTIEEWGGWAGSETLSKVYQHSLKMKQEEEKKKIASLFD